MWEMIPPQALEAEQSILGCCLACGCQTNLKPTDFYREGHMRIVEAIHELHGKGVTADAVSITELLAAKGQLEKIGGSIYVARLMESPGSLGNLEIYEAIVKEASLARKSQMESVTFLTNLNHRNGKAYHDIVWEHCNKLLQIVEEKPVESRVVGIRESCTRFVAELEARMDRGVGIQGIPTGWTEYDRFTGGLMPAQLIVVAGRPSMGKSAIAYNWMANMAKMGKSHLMFSGEASDQQITHRLITRESMIESDRVRGGHLSSAPIGNTFSAIQRVSEWPVSTVEAPFTDIDIVMKSRRHQADVIWVDHLALVNPSDRSTNKAVEVGNITRRLKLLTVELKKPVVLLCQLNREIEKEIRASWLSGLCGSGLIEEDADVILFVGVDKRKKKDADHSDPYRKIILAKQRDGDVGVWMMEFLGQYQHFQRPGRDWVCGRPFSRS